MSFRDLIHDVFRTLWAHRIMDDDHVWIAWGVVSIVLMVAAGEGLRVGQAKQAETLGRDLMIVFHGRTSLQAGGARAGRLVRWVNSDVDHLQAEAPDCQYAIPELEQNTVRSHTAFNAAAFTVTGSTPEFAEIRSLGVGEGRFYDQDDIAQNRRVAFLGSDAKKQLFASRPAVGQLVYLNDIPFTVPRRYVLQKSRIRVTTGGTSTKFSFLSRRCGANSPISPRALQETFDQLLVNVRFFEHHEACKGEVPPRFGPTA